MKLLLLLILVGVAISYPTNISESDLQEWEMFKLKYERNYETVEEEDKRKAIFLDHLKFIRNHKAKYARGETTFTVAINKFADLSNKEFSAMRKGLKKPDGWVPTKAQEFVPPVNAKVNSTVDWRNLGAVTPIKDQGDCGSCWSFSTTGSVEGQHFLSTGNLVSLSEQNLVDCSGAQGNYGCSGGYPNFAFEYIITNGGIDAEKSYPYKGVDGYCKYETKNKGATISSYSNITSGDEKALKVAVATVGPISISIDASQDSFQLYESGVYNEPKCSKDLEDLDHAVLVVGYGTYKGKAYWLVKNSWGTEWGMDGYIMMSRNKRNQCGVATAACFPVV